MPIHQHDENMRPDEEFEQGKLVFLVEGNQCRLLDGRRTPGYIEKYDRESGMFRWRITGFEDAGRYWEVPAEDISRYQFPKDAARLKPREAALIESEIEKFQKKLVIPISLSDRDQTEREIGEVEGSLRDWLSSHSRYFSSHASLSMDTRAAPPLLSDDLDQYLSLFDLEKIEQKTADNIVLNPRSGEWVKGMLIVLAEMGLAPFDGKAIRTRDIFQGLGAKKLRRQYLVHRLAFVRAAFRLSGIEEVVLYRGMSSEKSWQDEKGTLKSWTFSLKVARSFADFDRGGKFRHSYLMKRTFTVTSLFMTYLETSEMNLQYKEAEALVLHNEGMSLGSS